MSVNLISKSAYARHRGVDEKAVRKAVAEGRISLINGKIDPAVADIQWAANTRARAGSGGAAAAPGADLLTLASTVQADAPAVAAPLAPAAAVPDGYTAARARREMADAETSEIQLKKLRGEILITADVARAGFEVGRDLRDAMESSVNSLAAELASIGNADACADILRRHNRALQELLSKSFREKIGAAAVGGVHA